MSEPVLLGDIGGTHARFALAANGAVIGPVAVRDCADFGDPAALLTAALAGFEGRPRAALLAAAGAVADDAVRLTNLDWQLDGPALCRSVGFAQCRIVNDFTAVAWSLPRLPAAELEQVGGGAGLADAARAVIGPGTGLGVSALVPGENGWAAVSGEGGHASLASADDFEAAILSRLHAELGHVSYEAVLAGQGLVRLHHAIIEVTGAAAAKWTAEHPMRPADVTRLAREEPGGPAGQAMAVFSRLLGGYAGDLALIVGARGGVYIAGGIVPQLGPLFDRVGFRQRFEAKGRFESYLAEIPAYIITSPAPALIGLAALAADMMQADDGRV